MFPRNKVVSHKCGPKKAVTVTLTPKNQQQPLIVHQSAQQVYLSLQKNSSTSKAPQIGSSDAQKNNSSNPPPTAPPNLNNKCSPPQNIRQKSYGARVSAASGSGLPKSPSDAVIVNPQSSSMESGVLKSYLANSSQQPRVSKAASRQSGKPHISVSLVKQQNFTPAKVITSANRQVQGSGLSQNLSHLEKQSSTYNPSPHLQHNHHKQAFSQDFNVFNNTQASPYTQIKTPVTYKNYLRVPGNLLKNMKAHPSQSATNEPESFWENDSSLPDDMNNKPFEAAINSSGIHNPAQSCNSSTIFFGPKRPISRQIGSNEDEFVPSTDYTRQRSFKLGASSMRTNVLAKSLNFTKNSGLISQVTGLTGVTSNTNASNSLIKRQATVLGVSNPRSPFSPSALKLIQKSDKQSENTMEHKSNNALTNQPSIQKQQSIPKEIRDLKTSQSCKMSKQILQLLKSNDGLRNAPTPPEKNFKLDSGEMVRRVPFKMNQVGVTPASKNNQAFIPTTVPKIQINLNLNASQVTPVSISENAQQPQRSGLVSQKPSNMLPRQPVPRATPIRDSWLPRTTQSMLETPQTAESRLDDEIKDFNEKMMLLSATPPVLTKKQSKSLGNSTKLAEAVKEVENNKVSNFQSPKGFSPLHHWRMEAHHQAQQRQGQQNRTNAATYKQLSYSNNRQPIFHQSSVQADEETKQLNYPQNLFSATQVSHLMLPKKEGDQGLELCSVEDPSPKGSGATPSSFMRQFSGKNKQLYEQVPFIYLKKSQSFVQKDFPMIEITKEQESLPDLNPVSLDSADEMAHLQQNSYFLDRSDQKKPDDCLQTEPANFEQHPPIVRVITFEGEEVIDKASELTKSKSNVKASPSDYCFNQQPRDMPFEIAKQSDGADPQASAGLRLESTAKEQKCSMFFIDKRVLFDSISQLASNQQSIRQKESHVSGVTVGFLAHLKETSIQNKQQAAQKLPLNLRGGALESAIKQMQKSSSQLVFGGSNDVLSRREGVPFVEHQLRQTYLDSCSMRSFYRQRENFRLNACLQVPPAQPQQRKSTSRDQNKRPIAGKSQEPSIRKGAVLLSPAPVHMKSPIRAQNGSADKQCEVVQLERFLPWVNEVRLKPRQNLLLMKDAVRR